MTSKTGSQKLPDCIGFMSSPAAGSTLYTPYVFLDTIEPDSSACLHIKTALPENPTESPCTGCIRKDEIDCYALEAGSGYAVTMVSIETGRAAVEACLASHARVVDTAGNDAPLSISEVTRLNATCMQHLI